MDRRTAAVYVRSAQEWISRRGPRPQVLETLARFASRVVKDAPVADLGSGPGWYADEFVRRGLTSVALDLTPEMLAEAGRRFPGLPRVRADLSILPFAHRSLGGAWAVASLQHLPAADLPCTLAQLHHALRVGAPLELTLANLEALDPTPRELSRGVVQRRPADKLFPGRLFTATTAEHLQLLLERAGFERVRVDRQEERSFWLWARARSAFTLPDYVRPRLDLLICGLNPSLRAAETGIPFVGASNRFWPAALRAGLVERERDPWDALRRGVGFTDLVKRPTRGANELRPQEYAAGLRRLEASIRHHRPRVVCLVGMEGWRRAADPKAEPGWLPKCLAGLPTYLMPSTSGRNAHADLTTLTRHLRRAARGPRR